MSQQHSNTKKRSFQHLTPYQRGQIQALIEQRIPKVHIAKQVGIARSPLYEELKRSTVDQMRSDLTYYKRYFADTGQLVYMRRRPRLPPRCPRRSHLSPHLYVLVTNDRGCARCGT